MRGVCITDPYVFWVCGKTFVVVRTPKRIEEGRETESRREEIDGDRVIEGMCMVEAELLIILTEQEGARFG